MATRAADAGGRGTSPTVGAGRPSPGAGTGGTGTGGTGTGGNPGGSGDGEGGFVLLEAVISVSLLAIIMAALTTFTLTVISSTSYQRQRQAAVQVANSTLDTLRAMPASTLPNGRTPSAATTQFTAAPAPVAPWLTTMNPLSDASGATTPQLPMSTTTTIDNTVFTATNYLGTCTASASAVSGTTCDTTSVSDPVAYTRAVVAVTWAGPRCASGLCTLVTATLISPRSDPLFSQRQQPPTPPTITDPGTVLSWLGQTVSLQLATDPGSGVDPESWSATGLPAGLSISPSGLVTGQPTALGTSMVHLKVVDAFLRSGTRDVTWKVVLPVTGLTTPYTTTAGATVPAQSLAWTCSSNTCTYTLSGAPAGIGLSATAGGSPQSSLTVTAQTGTMYLVGSTAPAAAPAPGDMAAAVAAAGASDYWRLGERSGTAGADSTGSYPLVHTAGVTPGVPGAVLANADAAAAYSGAQGVSSSTTTAIPGPQTYSESLWFKTTTTSGGKLIGFGNQTTGDSSGYDRHLYLDNTGHLVAGVYTGGTRTVTSPGTYNDGQWHQVVSTLSSGSGLVLYVDGVQVAQDTTVTSAQPFSGYWRIGGDNLNGWPGAHTSNYVAATVDEVSIHPTALTPAQVATLYRAGTAGRYTLSIASTATSSTTPSTTATGMPVTAAWTVNPPPSVAGVATPLTGVAGTAVPTQALTYSCPSGACSFTGTGLPAGVGLATTPTGTPASPVSVTSTSGTLYLRGTVSSAAAPGSPAYPSAVAAQGATDYWRLGERSGTAGADSAGSYPLVHAAGVTVGAAGAIPTNADAAASYSGAQGASSSTTTAVTAPQTYTESLWFRTTTTNGGKLIGFGNRTTGDSSTYDRHVYLDNAGHLIAGVYPGGAKTVTSPGTYNDGQWHQVVATLSTGSGLVLYVDGAQVGQDTTATSAESATGYWRIGGDNLNGWPGTHTSNYVAATIDDVSIHPTALTPAQVAALYQAGTAASTGYSPAVGVVDSTTSVTGSGSSGTWTVTSPPTVGGLTATVRTLRGTSPGDQVLTYGCPTGSCTITLTGAPTGIGLTTSATGTPAATGTSTVTVTSTTGTVYLRGTVSSSASAGTYTLTLAPSDTATAAAGAPLTATWTVGDPPTVSGVGATLTTKQGVTIADQPLSYTCPSQSCTLSVSGAPSGIGLATVSGGAAYPSVSVTATSGTVYLRGTVSLSAPAQSYTVAVTPADTPTGGNGAASTGTWTVGPAPSVSGLTTPFAVTVGATVANQALTYSCPSSSCTLTLAGAPSGIGLFAASSGGTAASPLTVTTASGTVYLRGTVAANSATGTQSVTVTPTDTTTPTTTGAANTATWTVNRVPSVTGLPASGRATKGQQLSYGPLTYSCPSGSCTLAVSAGSGLGLAPDASATTPTSSIAVTGTSGTYYLRGTVPGTVGTYGVTVTPTDTAGNANVTGTTNTVNLTVDQPTVTGLTALRTTQGATIADEALSYTCPSGSCTFTISGHPGSIGLDTSTTGTASGSTSVPVTATSGTIYVRGSIGSSTTAQGYTVAVAGTDNTVGLSGSATTAAWQVVGPSSVTGLSGNFTQTRNATVNNSKSTYTCPNASCTITITGAPAGLGLSTSSTAGSTAPPKTITVSNGPATLYIQGNTGSTATTYSIAITPVDAAGVTGTVESFSLAVS